MTFAPRTSTTTWVVRPKVVTQEPTVGKTNYLNKKPQPTEARTEPQEPTPVKEVEPQEPVLPHDDARAKGIMKLIFSKIQRQCSRTLHNQFSL